MEKRSILTSLRILRRSTLEPIVDIKLGVFERPSQSEKIRASLVEFNPDFIFLSKHEELLPNLFPDDEDNAQSMDRNS
jgi:hypothetical protein|nr:MAG TPA: hypothetical protein [Microviridae sp.]